MYIYIYIYIHTYIHIVCLSHMYIHVYTCIYTYIPTKTIPTKICRLVIVWIPDGHENSRGVSVGWAPAFRIENTIVKILGPDLVSPKFFHEEVLTGVCLKDTPPERRTRRFISFQNTKSGAGEQYLLLCCRAKAHLKGLHFSQAPVS